MGGTRRRGGGTRDSGWLHRWRGEPRRPFLPENEEEVSSAVREGPEGGCGESGTAASERSSLTQDG